MNIGNIQLLQQHDEAAIQLLKQWDREPEALPEFVAHWCVHYLYRVESSVARSSNPDFIHTHRGIQDFISACDFEMTMKIYSLIYENIVRLLVQHDVDHIPYTVDGFHISFAELDDGDTRELWAKTWFSQFEQTTLSLMGWLRVFDIIFEERDSADHPSAEQLQRSRATIADSYGNLLEDYLSELRRHPRLCGALSNRMHKHWRSYAEPTPGCEKIWGWRKSIKRIRVLRSV